MQKSRDYLGEFTDETGRMWWVFGDKFLDDFMLYTKDFDEPILYSFQEACELTQQGSKVWTELLESLEDREHYAG